MGIEIERKFLLSNSSWEDDVIQSRKIIQGYLTQNAGLSSVRIRLDGEHANINIKSRELAISRQEYEYEIPVADAQHMLKTLCTGVIEKTRSIVNHEEAIWEIDVFSGDNEGLVVAEIELGSVDEVFDKPDWLGEDVSHDARYYNVNLIKHPFSKW